MAKYYEEITLVIVASLAAWLFFNNNRSNVGVIAANSSTTPWYLNYNTPGLGIFMGQPIPSNIGNPLSTPAPCNSCNLFPMTSTWSY